MDKETKARRPGGLPGLRAFSFPDLLFFRAFFVFCGSAFFFLLSQNQAAAAQDLNAVSTAISGGNTEQKRDALFQIRNLRSEIASRAALPALRDREPIVRATAAASVVYLPKPEAVAAIAPLLEDRDAFVRKAAAYALGTVESPEAAEPLIRNLRREKDSEVRSAAIVALGGTGNVAAVEPLLAVLQRRRSEETEFPRRAAARSIGQIAQILRGSGACVVTPQNFLPDIYKSLPGDDLTAKFIVFNAAVPILSSVLQSRRESDDARREAAYALGAIGSRSARTVLEARLNSPDPYLREIIREALLKINTSP